MQGGPILLPGFCIRKSLQPLLPVFLQVSFDATIIPSRRVTLFAYLMFLSAYCESRWIMSCVLLESLLPYVTLIEIELELLLPIPSLYPSMTPNSEH